eukprot:scaffold381862_cov48-Prasinocladus_malaysianus.AAC.1
MAAAAPSTVPKKVRVRVQGLSGGLESLLVRISTRTPYGSTVLVYECLECRLANIATEYGVRVLHTSTHREAEERMTVRPIPYE